MAAPRPERRLAAILAADIVGYSRLVERDEAGTLAAIKALRGEVIDPLLAEHHGRIVKLMGDGAIVEFGSVVDAVACAVAVQTAVAKRQADVAADQRIVFRIGINLGDVVVEGEDLLGDGVNVAARLEQLCDPGGVLVSGTAYDHLKGKLDLRLEPRGVQHLKNISEPVRVYRVAAIGAGAARRPSRAALHRWGLGVAALLFAVVFLAGVWWLWPVERASAAPSDRGAHVRQSRRRRGDGPAGRGADRGHHHRPRPPPRPRRHRPQLDRSLPGNAGRHSPSRHRSRCRLRPGRLDPTPGRERSGYRAAHRRADRSARMVPTLGPAGGRRVRGPDRDRRARRQHARRLWAAHEPDRGRSQA